MEKVHFGSYYGTFYRRTQFFMRETFKELGLSFVEAIALIFVLENPGAMQEEIANGLAIDKAAAARALKFLEKEGLLKRNVDEKNQRMKRVYGTERSKPYKVYFDQAMMCWNKQMLQDLSDEEQDLVVKLLRKMRDRAIVTDMGRLIEEVKQHEKNLFF